MTPRVKWMLGWMSGVPAWETSRPGLPSATHFPEPLGSNVRGQTLEVPPSASTIRNFGRTRKPMITTKCVGAVTETRGRPSWSPDSGDIKPLGPADGSAITGGSWYASPATHVGYELIGAAMLILAGGGRGFPLDYDELERCTRVGFERGMRSRNGER
jgi:hypothetical protein